jgi:hypothetical protein
VKLDTIDPAYYTVCDGNATPEDRGFEHAHDDARALDLRHRISSVTGFIDEIPDGSGRPQRPLEQQLKPLD